MDTGAGAANIDPENIQWLIQGIQQDRDTAFLPAEDLFHPGSTDPKSFERSRATTPRQTNHHHRSHTATTNPEYGETEAVGAWASKDPAESQWVGQGSRPRQISTSTYSQATAGVDSCFESIGGESLVTMASTVPSTSSPVLEEPEGVPCEFHVLMCCPNRYHLQDRKRWIKHVARDHLGYRYPRVCRCWFCDEVFRSPSSSSREDRGDNWQRRMKHVWQHFRSNQSLGSLDEFIRPDFDMVEHCWRHGLIDDEMYNHAIKYAEGPDVRRWEEENLNTERPGPEDDETGREQSPWHHGHSPDREYQERHQEERRRHHREERERHRNRRRR